MYKSKHSELQLGRNGQKVVTTTAATTGNFFAVQVVADAIISAVTFQHNYEITGSWTSLGTIPAGTVLYGRFSSLTLTSGKAILYLE